MSEKEMLNAVVYKCRRIAGTNVFYLILKVNDYYGPEPGIGQFCLFKALNSKTRLSRPFTIARYSKSGNYSYFCFYIQKVGLPDSNTHLYSKMKQGDKLQISYPKGKPFKLPPGVNKWIVTAGGTGQAALARLNADYFSQINLRREIIIGVKDHNHLYGLGYHYLSDYFHVITEEDGLATDLLQDVLRYNQDPASAVISCGPSKMLKAVAELCQTYKTDCYVIMEAMMGCGGEGSCFGCPIPMLEGAPQKCCEDGPLFNAADIDWSKVPLNEKAPAIIPGPHKPKNPLAIGLKDKSGRTILSLSTPFMAASGTLGIKEAQDNPNLEMAGAYVVKGIRLEAEKGNNPPRIAEVPTGVLNAIGLQGIGIDDFIENELPLWLKLGKPVIINIAGKTVSEFGEIAGKLKQAHDKGYKIAALEVNISCPNTDQGGMAFGQDSKMTFRVVRAVITEAGFIPTIAKLTPNVTDIVKIAKAAVFGGADMISLINTVTGIDVNINTRRSTLGKNFGGYSGPGILPIALYKVHKVYQKFKGTNLSVPIIGMGGISGGQDVIKFMLLGANAVMIGTEWMVNKNIFNESSWDLESYLKEQDCNSVADIVGQAVLY